MTAGGPTDPDFGGFLRTVRSERRIGMSRVINAILTKDVLAVNAERATDVVEVVQSMTTYNSVVRDCGWSTEQYKAWAYRTLAQLLAPVTPARALALDSVATAGLSFEAAFAAAPTPSSSRAERKR